MASTVRLGTNDQWLRASQSIPLNIAEGNGKTTDADRRRYFEIARGSALECAAIQDVLVVGKAVDEAESQERKHELDRMAAMLSRLGGRGCQLGEEHASRVGIPPATMAPSAWMKTPRFLLAIHVRQSEPVTHQFRPGTNVEFCIHSQKQLFGEDPAAVIGRNYEFSVVEVTDWYTERQRPLRSPSKRKPTCLYSTRFRHGWWQRINRT